MQEETNGKNKAQAKDINNETATRGNDFVKFNIFTNSSNNFSRRTRTSCKL